MEQTKRKIIVIKIVLLTIAFALSLCIFACNAFAGTLQTDYVKAEEDHSHDGYMAWTSETSLPDTADNYYLTADVTISSTWNVPSGTTNLCLNGHGIIMTGSGSVVYISGGSELNLYDCDETTEHKFTVSDPAANGAGLATVNDSLTENYQTFVGGYITGGNANPYGGGVRVAKTGKFNMYGGTIIGNKASSHGGGVTVSQVGVGASNTRNFVMSGGAICYNTANWGGGIGVYGEVYISENALISKNTATAGGAGIELESNGKLYLDGGNITENLLLGQNGGMWKGAGVHVPGGSEFHIKGAPQLTNNYQSDGTTKNNVFVRSGLKVTVDDTLAAGARIGVAIQDTTGVFTVGLSGKGTAENFISDNGDYGVLLKDGEAQIGVRPHEHDGVTFEKWTSTNSLPTSGNYYLAGDVTVSSTTTITGTLNLCLCGHGIRMSGTSRFFYVSGGAFGLYDCDTTTTHKYNISAPAQGAGLATVNDALTENYETFTGGYVTGANTSQWGAAVCIENGGLFTLNGGTIIGNTMSGSMGGGGVALKGYSGDRFVMNGGAVIGNTITNGWGGGIYIHEGASFTMNGGVIKENYASKSGNGCGGGISIEGGSSSFILTGGQIVDNVAQNHGGNVNLAAATTNISGSVIITGGKLTSGKGDNVYVNGTRVLNIDGALGSDASIGVTRATGAFTSGWSTYMTDGESKIADPAKYFFNDANNGYEIFLNASGEAELGTKPHEHDGLSFTKWTSTNSLPTSAGNYYLAADVEISETWNAPNGVNLCLCGHGIRKTGSGSVIKVGEGITLKLYDCDTTTEHRYSISSPAANGAGVATVNDSLTSGYQTFTGGYITGGYITGGYQYGAGINLEGNGATLYMYGGTIIGNRLTAGSTGGGGVCVQDWDKSGGFYMYGGAIIGNTSNYGGGVYVRTGKMELIGGTICNNVANGNIGGGVLVFGGGSTLEVKGGVIRNNMAVHGGAVEASGDGTVIISGGSFTDNMATGQGGALTNQRTDGNTSPASFYISGAPVFSGNTSAGKANDVYLCNTAVLNLTAALTNTSKIGIKKASTTGTFTSGWATYMTDGEDVVADPANYFTSDNGDYIISNQNGEAAVAIPEIDPDTVSVETYDGDYDGTGHTASVTGPDNSTVSYGTTQGVYTLDDCPTYTDAGEYTVYYKITKTKYNPYYGSLTVNIKPINATVTITGHSGAVDYDGTEHSVSGYDAEADTTLYDVTEDFTFSGTAEAARTDAGTTEMGLAADQFENTNTNFETVTFVITDGYQTIKPINATVTITGHSVTADYNGTEKTATGYDAVASTDLYDVTKDFTFFGTSTAAQTDVGTAYMGLTADLFLNTNPNFATVTFEIEDGYITIRKIKAVIITAPKSADPFFIGDDIALIIAGEAKGGTISYALGTSEGIEPDEGSYQTTVPFAKEAGDYFVWYIVKGDKNHEDLSPECLKVTITESNEGTLHGILYKSDGETPVDGAKVTLKQGEDVIASADTANGGRYHFAVPSGVYDIVAEHDGITVTVFVEVKEETEKNIVMPSGKTVSNVQVGSDEEGNDLGVVVGGLDKEAQAIRDENPNAANVSVLMTVDSKSEDTAKNADTIVRQADDKSFAFFEIKVEKTIDSISTAISETKNIMEIVIPYAKASKRGITVYSYHNGVRAFEENDSKEDGTFRIDKENNLIYIYANKFSTYAIGYTPYYRVQTSLSLGSYEGKASVTIKNDADENISFALESADASNIVFPDVPKGRYTMTVIWEDGKANTLTMTLTVGPKVVLSAMTDQMLQREDLGTQTHTAYINTPDESTVLSVSDKIEPSIYFDSEHETVVFKHAPVIAKKQGMNCEIGLIPSRRNYGIIIR